MRAGADIIELGVPFSDPMAEGPVIQRAHERALEKGVSLADILVVVAQFRQADTDTPVLLMGYANPVVTMGYRDFADRAAESGLDALLTVDMPPEETAALNGELKRVEMDNIFLVAPTTPTERIEKIAAVATGFVYYVSFKGVTGASRLDVPEVAERLAVIRRYTQLPLAVGLWNQGPGIGGGGGGSGGWRGRRQRPGSADGDGGGRGLFRRGGSRPGRRLCDRVARGNGQAGRDMNWYDKILPSGVRKPDGERKSSVPDGLWKKCVKCEAVLYRPELERNLDVCPKCDHHMRIDARRRVDVFLDENAREELFADVEPVDRLKFQGHQALPGPPRHRPEGHWREGRPDRHAGLLAGRAPGGDGLRLQLSRRLDGLCGGGEVHPRRATGPGREHSHGLLFRLWRRPDAGGADIPDADGPRPAPMLERLKEKGIPYISVMTDPIYGGVSASLALLGDINIAEPDARAGFAGPNVIEQTIRQKLPKGFQRSEFLLEHGAIDMIVSRNDMRPILARLLAKMTGRKALVEGARTEH